MFSYQCSQLSTPHSVIEVFHGAKKFQEKQDTSSYVAVVVLDEVGLAEDSPNLPLKALHPLLEDGTEGASSENSNKVSLSYLGVSFIMRLLECLLQRGFPSLEVSYFFNLAWDIPYVLFWKKCIYIAFITSDYCSREEGGLYRYFQLGPGSCQDE